MKFIVDYSFVPPRQDAVHIRLEEWAKWVRVSPKPWATQPMWRNAKTPRQWDIDPTIHRTLNTLECSEMERAVSILPDKHRGSIRWCYVYSYIPDTAIRREYGLTREALAKMIVDGRDMLANRLKQKLVDKRESVI